VTLVDTNILIDILSDDPNWRAWSVTQLEQQANHGPLLINDVIYAELSSRYSTQELLDRKVSELNVERQAMPRHALFLAGHVFERYRRNGGTRNGVLPDFFIGAHAEITGWPLLTRDVRRYRTYFPKVQLIAPDLQSFAAVKRATSSVIARTSCTSAGVE
jgi:predicted nucleic acid-binding protein